MYGDSLINHHMLTSHCGFTSRKARVKCRSRSDRWRSRAAWRSRAMYLCNVKWTKVIAYAYDAWRSRNARVLCVLGLTLSADSWRWMLAHNWRSVLASDAQCSPNRTLCTISGAHTISLHDWRSAFKFQLSVFQPWRWLETVSIHSWLTLRVDKQHSMSHCVSKAKMYTSQTRSSQRAVVIQMKWNEWGFGPPLCTSRLNWARRTSWGWWDE